MTQGDASRPSEEAALGAVSRWVDTVVAGLNLCPFAKRELDAGRVRYSFTNSSTTESLRSALENELLLLKNHSGIETSLLVHPYVLDDFFDYNEFLNTADALLEQLSLTGVFQIASFHPQYQFAGTALEDPENYSNRAPYPLLHILREDAVARAIDTHSDIHGISAKNIELLRSMGEQKLEKILLNCFTASDEAGQKNT